MAINVKHLNADTTFLLSLFADSSSLHHARPDFTILIDPWLAGSSSVWNPRFQISHHTSDPIITSIAHIPLPDIILISQDKPDHCHEETLRTLPPDTDAHILAVPGAAKRIKSWAYFTNATITTLPIYNPRNPDTIIRIPLKPSDSLFGIPGEITLAYIPQKYDMTGLHNAVGITYLPPSSATTLSIHGLPVQNIFPPSPPHTPDTPDFPTHHHHYGMPVTMDSNLFPDSPTSPIFPRSFPVRPQSIIYTPHGIGIPCITPYMQEHLARMSALPLTALFHSINVEQNPWFLGGLVATGFPGGAALVRQFGAKYWISAHDEAKDNRGWATAMIKSTHYTVEEVQVLVDDVMEKEAERIMQERDSGMTVRPRATKVIDLDVGEGLTMGS